MMARRAASLPAKNRLVRGHRIDKAAVGDCRRLQTGVAEPRKVVPMAGKSLSA
jgi:hypothetical protein